MRPACFCWAGFYSAVVVFGCQRVADAQTVQLPTLNSFGVSTSVLVPDHGTAGAGGIRRTGSAWRGYGRLPAGGATGGMTSAAGARASVVIHDLARMDADLLAGDGQTTREAAVANRPNELLSGPFRSVAEIRRMKPAQVQSRRSNAIAAASGKNLLAQSLKAQLPPSNGNTVRSTTRK
jgi:hypothetical protein